MTAPKEDEKKHFVLVHGACHGAWCWYKLKPRLDSAGHRVTAVDLLASGINTKKIEDVHSMSEYSQPLLELISSLPSHEKVVLVGHSLGGLNLALAMEKFPHKILVAVFLTAFMPDTIHQPSYVIDQEDLAKENKFSDKAYGSVPRVYAVCDEDKAIPVEFQRWMIETAA